MINVFNKITPIFKMHHTSLTVLRSDENTSASATKLYAWLRYRTRKRSDSLSLETLHDATGLSPEAVASARKFLVQSGLITATAQSGQGASYTFATPDVKPSEGYFQVPDALMLKSIYKNLNDSDVLLYLTALLNVNDDTGQTPGRNSAILRVKNPGERVRNMTKQEFFADAKLTPRTGKRALEKLIEAKLLRVKDGALEVLNPVNGQRLIPVDPADAEDFDYSEKGSSVRRDGSNLKTRENFERFYEPHFFTFDPTKTQQNNLICPFDHDHDAFSLNLEIGKWKCHACSDKQEKPIKGGMREFQLFLDKLEDNEENKKISMRRVCETLGVTYLSKRPKIGHYTEVYNHPLKDGTPYQQTLRYANSKKDIARQRQWDASKKRFVFSLTGPRILHNWPDVAKASVVLVTEGERGADQLKEFCDKNNIRDEFNRPIATTCSGGDKTWNPIFAEELLNKKIIVLPDADIPGDGYWEDVCDSLDRVGNESYITVRFDSFGKDVRAYLNKAKPSAAEFLEYIKSNLSVQDAAKYVDNPWLTIEPEPELIEP